MKYKLQDLDVTIYFCLYFISKVLSFWQYIFDVIIFSQQKRSFIAIDAITQLLIFLNLSKISSTSQFVVQEIKTTQNLKYYVVLRAFFYSNAWFKYLWWLCHLIALLILLIWCSQIHFKSALISINISNYEICFAR